MASLFFHITAFAAESKGDWIVTTNKDRRDGTMTAEGSLKSINGMSKNGVPITLYLRCQDKQTQAYVAWGEFLDMECANIKMVFDGSEATTDEWNVANTKTATVWPGNAFYFIQKLVTVKKLSLQLIQNTPVPDAAMFDLTGIETVASKLGKACGWEIYLEHDQPEVAR